MAKKGGLIQSECEGSQVGFVSRLQGMNISIANFPNASGQDILSERLAEKARDSCAFILDWHQGGKHNPYACTSMICRRCRARLLVQHPAWLACEEQ